MTSRPADTWASGAPYEHYVGRWSSRVGRQFFAWLAVSPRARWLDVGCGTGSLTESILETTSPASVDAVDSSEGFVGYARERIKR